MSLSIHILPFSTSLDLDGVPDASSAYSLSGHVVISLKSPSLIFGRLRPRRFLLHSLVLTFEGQMELLVPEIGYKPYRICSVTKELAPDDPVELNDEGHKNSGEPCAWNIVFNLAIPGWLPPSSTVAEHEIGPVSTRYSLYARARFSTPDGPCDNSWTSSILSSMCTPMASSIKVVRAPRCEITIDRVIIAPSARSSSLEVPHKTFYVQVNDDSAFSFPPDVLPTLRVTVSVPEYVDMEDHKFPLRLRIRAEDLDPIHCGRLRMSDFMVDVMQLERYRTKPSSGYTGRFPVPPESLQPPNVPLLTPHPWQQLQGLGIVPEADDKTTIDRTFSVIPEESSGIYLLSGDGYIFLSDGEDSSGESAGGQTWYSIEPSVRFVHQKRTKNERAGDHALRASGTSPLFVVQHQMCLSLTCTYDIDGDQEKRVTAKLEFNLPIAFARVRKNEAGYMWTARNRPSSLGQPDTPTTANSAGPLTPTASCYCANTLPAYSQLFESNGDRKIDYSLPAYTPSASTTGFDENVSYMIT